jgi:hypothetical protein
MLEKLRYKNHINETLDFGIDKLFVNENDLRDFAWSVTSKNDKISGFKKGIEKKSIPIIIKCDTAEKGLEMRNKIFEVTEKDVLANIPGKIVIGDYYLKCYVTGISKGDYLISKQYMTADIDIQTDTPSWIKEQTLTYKFINEDSGGGNIFLDPPHDYPFDYSRDSTSKNILNDSFVPTNFEIIIYGAVTNPAIHIGGNTYAVNVEIDTNEYLTINSIEKTIYLTRRTGEKINCFNYRDRNNYVFEKIPTGSRAVTANVAGLKFDITLYEERSEPKWI